MKKWNHFPYLYDVYYKAIMEHVVLLKCEGLTYAEIQERTGLTIGQVRHYYHKFALRLQKATKNAKFKITVD